MKKEWVCLQNLWTRYLGHHPLLAHIMRYSRLHNPPILDCIFLSLLFHRVRKNCEQYYPSHCTPYRKKYSSSSSLAPGTRLEEYSRWRLSSDDTFRPVKKRIVSDSVSLISFYSTRTIDFFKTPDRQMINKHYLKGTQSAKNQLPKHS